MKTNRYLKYGIHCLAVFLLSGIAQAQSENDSQTLPKEIAKWEKDIKKLEAKDSNERNAEGSVLFCGSSSIRLWKTIHEDMAPWKCIQRGYGGAKLTDLNHYAPRLIGPWIGKENANRCRAVVVFVANDISGKKDKADPTPDTVIKRFKRLHTWVRARDADIPFFWIEVTPTERRWHVWRPIEQATKGIRKVIDTDENSFLISTAGAYLGVDGKPRPELFVKDKLHLNANGYTRWASLIKTALHRELGAAVSAKSAAMR